MEKKNKVFTLQQMTDFVLEQAKLHTSTYELAHLLINYARFLKQQLAIWMFVPCKFVDGVWVVLEEPNHYEDWFNKSIKDPHWKITEECSEYQEAKDRVLFEGFEYKGESDFSFIFKYKKTFPTMIPKLTVELLANRYKDIKLTPTAQKQIGL